MDLNLKSVIPFSHTKVPQIHPACQRKHLRFVTASIFKSYANYCEQWLRVRQGADWELGKNYLKLALFPN